MGERRRRAAVSAVLPSRLGFSGNVLGPKVLWQSMGRGAIMSRRSERDRGRRKATEKNPFALPSKSRNCTYVGAGHGGDDGHAAYGRGAWEKNARRK